MVWSRVRRRMGVVYLACGLSYASTRPFMSAWNKMNQGGEALLRLAWAKPCTSGAWQRRHERNFWYGVCSVWALNAQRDAYSESLHLVSRRAPKEALGSPALNGGRPLRWTLLLVTETEWAGVRITVVEMPFLVPSVYSFACVFTPGFILLLDVINWKHKDC